MALGGHEKARVVAKLRAARKRKRALTGKAAASLTPSYGRKSWRSFVSFVADVPKVAKGHVWEIAAELAQRGIMNERGRPFSAASINSMLR